MPPRKIMQIAWFEIDSGGILHTRNSQVSTDLLLNFRQSWSFSYFFDLRGRIFVHYKS